MTKTNKIELEEELVKEIAKRVKKALEDNLTELHAWDIEENGCRVVVKYEDAYQYFKVEIEPNCAIKAWDIYVVVVDKNDLVLPNCEYLGYDCENCPYYKNDECTLNVSEILRSEERKNVYIEIGNMIKSISTGLVDLLTGTYRGTLIHFRTIDMVNAIKLFEQIIATELVDDIIRLFHKNYKIYKYDF